MQTTEAENQTEAMDVDEEVPSEAPERAAGVLFRDVGRNKEHFDALVQTATVLIESGKPLQASELVAECLSRLTSKRTTDK